MKPQLMLSLAILLGVAPGVYSEDVIQPLARETDTHAIFRAVGSLYRIDPELLEAIAVVESGNNTDAISPKGARGLMQLMPATAHRFRVRDSSDPVDNALGAARFLDYLRSRQARSAALQPNLVDLLAAYNAGEAPIVRYRGVPPYPETRAYVRRVLLRYLFDRLPPKSAADSRRAKSQIRGQEDPLAQLDEIRRERETALPRSRSVGRQ